MKDANGIEINENDRVVTFDIDGKLSYGTLRYGKTYNPNNCWYIDYDDGESCVVLDWSQVFAYMCVEFEMGMLDEKCKQMCPFCRSV